MHRISPQSCVLLIFGATLVCSGGCRDERPQRANERIAVKVEEAPDIRVHADSDHFYRYFPPGQRKAETVMTLAEVPEESRGMVLVAPRSAPPAGVVYVADLRVPQPDGTYPYEKISQSEWGERIAEHLGPAPEPPPVIASTDEPESEPGAPGAVAKNEIIMFSASWCGVCSKARRWFFNKGLKYVEKDIETTPGARKEMQERAQKAGLSPQQLSGVPVIWVNGQMLPGFDPRAIEAALRSI